MAAAALGLALALAAAAPVQTGLDRLEATGGEALRGRRLGLLAHAASVTTDGRHAVDVLRSLRLDLRRLYAPEHGVRGLAAAGEAVADGRDPATGLTVTSLYGARARPAPADFQGIDTLVVDLQDAGVRFYTYASTLILCLDAAADAAVEIVVLDRPNPLGGELVEGPQRDAHATPSLLALSPGPLVHGLTLGEMARMVNAGRAKPARLTVVAMTGWERAMRWPATGRAWTPPSPNLRSAEAALAYPGTCLLEATTLSEGRGTASPFLLIGAPGLDADALLRDLTIPGYALARASFVPEASTAAPRPKFEGQRCEGLRIEVSDVAQVRPYRLGLTLLRALRKAGALSWRDGGRAMDTLMGTRQVREAIDRGDAVAAIEAADAPAVAAFREARQAALLYR